MNIEELAKRIYERLAPLHERQKPWSEVTDERRHITVKAIREVLADEDMISLKEVRRVLNQRMSHHESEMRRWKETLDARKDENDHALNAKLEIDIACHQSVWCILLALAGDLKVKLDAR